MKTKSRKDKPICLSVRASERRVDFENLERLFVDVKVANFYIRGAEITRERETTQLLPWLFQEAPFSPFCTRTPFTSPLSIYSIRLLPLSI